MYGIIDRDGPSRFCVTIRNANAMRDAMCDAVRNAMVYRWYKKP